MSDPRSSRFVRVLQVLTAGAAVFAALGGCAIPINHPQRPRHHRVRPIVIRLSGTWDAVPGGEAPFRPLRLTLRQTGASVEGVLHLPERTLRAWRAARIDSRGRFLLEFGQGPEPLSLRLQIEARPLRLSGTLTDADHGEAVRFVRR